MEKKNDSTILLLVAAGLGIYWFMKNKSMPPATTTPVVVPTTTPVTTPVVSVSVPITAPALPIDQTVISTQPVYQAPVYQAPTSDTSTLPIDQTIISTQPVYQAPVYDQPVYEPPVYSVPVDQTPVNDQPVIDVPVQSVTNPDYTPITDMLTNFNNGGGLTNDASQNIVPIDNINLSPQSALSDQYL